MLGRLATLLGTQRWPGWLHATEAAPCAFAVANDFHHDGPACDPWFERLFESIGRHPGLEFCVGLGDLSHQGQPESLEAIRRLSRCAGVPFYPVPGNHDNDLDGTMRRYAAVFPGRINYSWTQAGWQFVALDTTDGAKWKETHIAEATLAWVEEELARLDPRKPTVIFTHFPLGAGVRMRPLNADELLARFAGFNVRAAFCGHFHGRSAVRRGDCDLVTNVCCSRVAANHDESIDKGYWLCAARADGTLTRALVTFAG